MPFIPLGDLPHPGIKPASPASPDLASGFLTTEHPGSLRAIFTQVFVFKILKYTAFLCFKNPICHQLQNVPSLYNNEREKDATNIYTMEYYSDIKKNIFESVLMRWMKLESIIQSEVSQKENTNIVY